MAAERRGEATWSGNLTEGSGAVSLASSGLANGLPVTWASRTEDHGGKTSPEELIAAAHAACFSMFLANVLAQGGNPAEKLDVSAISSFEKVEAGFRMTTMALEVRGSVPGLGAAAFEQAAEVAKEGCPVSNALKGNVEITVKAALA
jgi:osmotically inducible protein OsmC